MNYAPVLIPTLNRFDHLLNCIESLKNNRCAQYTDLYIALDYPPSEKYIDGYKKIEKYLQGGIDGFNRVFIIKRNENYGATKNLVDMMEKVLESYDRIIVSEDDNIFSPCFLEYINGGLDYFDDNGDVIGICGYSHNIKWSGSNAIVACNAFFSAWGFGMTRKQYLECKEQATMQSFREFAKNSNVINKILNITPRNFEYFYGSLYNHGIFFNDTAISVYMLASDKYCIMPRQSLVKNTGWDGSGVNCDSSEGNIYNMQVISEEESFPKEAFNNVFVNKTDSEMINEIYKPHQMALRKSKNKLKLINIVGIELYFKIYETIRGIYKKIKCIRN